ncbi:hypothetical protein Tco_1125627 [Tanacetum coccineum]|uniref:Uncharacterized protein n=1 Tax=Tanacetum coccineum TaxID=301880 RepID=A0ABQ5JCC5_9ASTR
MSSPNHFTSDIEDAFSSINILNYTSVSSDYFPASAGSSSFNSSKNSTDNYNTISISLSTINPDKMYLKHHEKQVEDILNYLDELYLHHIEKMEEGQCLSKGRQHLKPQVITLDAIGIELIMASPQLEKSQAAAMATSDISLGTLTQRKFLVPGRTEWTFATCIEGNVTASKPQTLEEAINISQRLMDQIIKRDSVQEPNNDKRKLKNKGNIVNNNNNQNNYNNNNVTMIHDSRIEDKKPSRFILPPTDILETVLCVKDAPYIT